MRPIVILVTFAVLILAIIWPKPAQRYYQIMDQQGRENGRVYFDDTGRETHVVVDGHRYEIPIQ